MDPPSRAQSGGVYPVFVSLVTQAIPVSNTWGHTAESKMATSDYTAVGISGPEEHSSTISSTSVALNGTGRRRAAEAQSHAYAWKMHHRGTPARERIHVEQHGCLYRCSPPALTGAGAAAAKCRPREGHQKVACLSLVRLFNFDRFKWWNL